MSKRLWWLAAIAAVGFASQLSAQEPGHKAATAQPHPAAANDRGTDAAQAAKGDSQALGLLAAVNEHEIAAAKQAVSKKVSGDVLDYANFMLKEHTANLDKTKALGQPSNDAEVMALKNKGKQDLASLNAKTGDAYSKAYIDAMVKGHTEVLGMIDQKMMPAARSAAVKQHLTETRTHVANHLARAQAIAAAR